MRDAAQTRRWVASGDVARARTVAGHAREVLDMLHHHHMGEDELLWPRLSARTRFHADLLARMDSQHQGLAVLLEQAATALAEWQDAPTVHMSTPLTVILNQLSTGLNEHFDEEEAAILPIVEHVITAVEYREVGLRGLVSIPLTRRLIVLGYILEGATSQERNVFLAAIPDPSESPTASSENASTATRPPVSAARCNPEGSTDPGQRPVTVGQCFRLSRR